ncbi:MAG TPA: DUF2800 domain-containing protein [Gemmatimonadales bacterium]|nr:DUF2800 domain-containing protein [Gemmatimonadales bacterium]
MSADLVQPKTHAALGASSADRWMNCPASVRLQEGVPGDGANDYSREGTTAHAVLEMALKRNCEPHFWIDTMVEGVLVTEEMADAVATCIEVVRETQREHPDAVLDIERRFSLAALNPPAEMFGTSDVVLRLPAARRLVVIDYKHGQGHAVAAKGNPQLRYYGLGATLAVERDIGPGRIDSIELVIVQPRAVHADGIIRRETIAYDELVAFSEDLLAAAHTALDPASEPVAGPWCRFCRAQAICPAQRAMVAVTAQTDFTDEVRPPLPETLTPAMLVRVLEARPVIESWLKAVVQYAEGELSAGRDVPGYKLVAKRAMRKWIEDEKAIEARCDELGISPEEYQERKLKSVASLEKVVGKKSFTGQFADLITKESSGFTLAPVADSRPAITAGAQSEFAE